MGVFQADLHGGDQLKPLPLSRSYSGIFTSCRQTPSGGISESRHSGGVGGGRIFRLMMPKVLHFSYWTRSVIPTRASPHNPSHSAQSFQSKQASYAYYLYTQLGLAGGPEHGKLAPFDSCRLSCSPLFEGIVGKPDHLVVDFGGMYCETCWRHVIGMVPTWCSRT